MMYQTVGSYVTLVLDRRSVVRGRVVIMLARGVVNLERVWLLSIEAWLI